MTKSREMKASEVCALLGVELPKSFGEDRILNGVAPLSEAGPSQVAYIQSARVAGEAGEIGAGLVIVPANIQSSHPGALPVANVMEAVVKVLNAFHPPAAATAFVHPSAVVDPTAVIGENTFIGPFVVIEKDAKIGANCRLEAQCFVGEGATIGDGSRLHARAVVMEFCEIGKRVEIHPGAVIGADGFRYEVLRRGLTKVPQVGRVVIGDDVEIGANTTIDRAGLSVTRVGPRTKIDNLVQIGHNCEIGSDCVIVAQVGIAGSCKIGRGVMIGGGASLKDHLTIGNGVKIAGRSGVQHDLADGAEVIGNPALPIREYARFTWFYRNFSAQWSRLKKVIGES
ncbi:UDP-3-O-(3-hydroxymyristoyl)glucosamine N-acyltransferase [bacterium]|nr:UDP-3-O-(3-hydroxymyristoyl)glucosamine N-acyltransferase [bacterium]